MSWWHYHRAVSSGISTANISKTMGWTRVFQTLMLPMEYFKRDETRWCRMLIMAGLFEASDAIYHPQMSLNWIMFTDFIIIWYTNAIFWTVESLFYNSTIYYNHVVYFCIWIFSESDLHIFKMSVIEELVQFLAIETRLDVKSLALQQVLSTEIFHIISSI